MTTLLATAPGIHEGARRVDFPLFWLLILIVIIALSESLFAAWIWWDNRRASRKSKAQRPSVDDTPPNGVQAT